MPVGKSIPCIVNREGILIPVNANYTVLAELIVNESSDDDSPTAILRWEGKNRAFLTYDCTGNFVIGFTIMEISFNAFSIEQSVNNILSVI